MPPLRENEFTSLTSALQELINKFIKGSWIIKEAGHLVEVVGRHNDVLWVPHDVDHLRRKYKQRHNAIT